MSRPGSSQRHAPLWVFPTRSARLNPEVCSPYRGQVSKGDGIRTKTVPGQGEQQPMRSCLQKSNYLRVHMGLVKETPVLNVCLLILPPKPAFARQQKLPEISSCVCERC